MKTEKLTKEIIINFTKFLETYINKYLTINTKKIVNQTNENYILLDNENYSWLEINELSTNLIRIEMKIKTFLDFYEKFWDKEKTILFLEKSKNWLKWFEFDYKNEINEIKNNKDKSKNYFLHIRESIDWIFTDNFNHIDILNNWITDLKETIENNQDSLDMITETKEYFWDKKFFTYKDK